MGSSIVFRITPSTHLPTAATAKPSSSTSNSSGVTVISGDDYCGFHALYQKIAQIWKNVWDSVVDYYYWLLSCVGDFGILPTQYPEVNTNMSKDALQKIYWGLGKENKWREYIDGRYHDKGKFVFDKGTHAGTVEPGFAASMEKAVQFTQHFLGKKIDADWYLRLHKQTCGHFNGDPKIYLMGQEKVGVFRASDDKICWKGCHGIHQLTKEAVEDFTKLDAELKKEFGPSYGLGKLTLRDKNFTPIVFDSNFVPVDCYMYYTEMNRDQVRRVFNKFLNGFYQEIEKAKSSDDKLLAIAKLYQRLEWLHAPKDGCSRTDTVLLNKLLTDYGLHPAILDHPFVSSSYGLARWKLYLKHGLIKWERLKARVNPAAP